MNMFFINSSWQFQNAIVFMQLIFSCMYVDVYVASLISVQSEYLQEGLQTYLCA